MKKLTPAALALALALTGCQDVTHPGAAAPDRPAANQIAISSSPLSVNIEGPIELTEEGAHFYEATVEGGVPLNHTYVQWYVAYDRDNGYERLLGNSLTQQVNVIAEEGNFRLRVTVNRGGEIATDYFYVTNLMTCGQDHCPIYP